jgi:hypothetical protein
MFEFESLLRRLTTTGWRRGRTGSRTWIIVAAVAGGIRFLRYVARDQQDILFRTRVVEGDQFEITTRAPGKR